ncbi:myb/SANT-like DNA-binding domain-containing protein 4 [Eurosta solidaginis]|uniref:myb/SANT-like DNA-binding domain-containing protein 4 n=1 Tax=Eurosta solidaginis TaxID=178769 RepID=UPI0035314F1A
MKIAKTERRTRAPNFTTSETILLCKILKNHKFIIENRKNDGAALIQKEKAWKQVTKEFNATSKGCTRTMKSLQLNYKNLKKRMAKKYASTTAKISADKSTSSDEMNDSVMTTDSWDKIANSTGIPAEVCQEILIDFINETDVQEEEVRIKILHTDEQSTDPLKEKQENMEIEKPENVDVENSINYKSKLRNDNQPQLKGISKLPITDKETIAENLKIVTYQKELLRIQLIEEEEKLEHNRILREMEYEDAREKYEHNALIRKLQVEKYLKKQEKLM